jgi:Concanavalin A-like lectin/glucanases superfamily/Secretion system C-terminal sorting domain
MMKYLHLSIIKSALAFLVLYFLVAGEISAQTPQYYNYQGVGAVNNSFPFNVASGKAVQWLFLPGEFNQPAPLPAGKQITTVYFWVNNGATTTFTNLVILMAKDTITSMTSGAFYTGPMDTVYFKASVQLTGASTSWASITLDKPYTYDPTKSLIVMVGQCGASGAGWIVRQNAMPQSRRIWSVGGCPFTPYSSQDFNIVNFGVDVVNGAQSVNRALKLATPGINTTYVSVPYNAGMVGFGNNITIETWINPGGTTTAATVLNKGVASFDYQLGVSLTTMLPFFRAGSTIATCPFAIQAGVWQHLAVVSDGSTVTFYLNGVPGTPVTAACVLGSSANEMRIGRGNNDAGSGMLDELRIWSVARTQTEINNNKCNKWIPNSTSGLKAIWHFDSTYVDSVSNWNGTPMGTAGFDTASYCTTVTSVTSDPIVPKNYFLGQNYPNPFNPTTNIKFSIPKEGYVEIKLYNILGKEVATLVSNPYTAGNYIFSFNASFLPSGIYFYKLVTNDFTAIKKMMLIK